MKQGGYETVELNKWSNAFEITITPCTVLGYDYVGVLNIGEFEQIIIKKDFIPDLYQLFLRQYLHQSFWMLDPFLQRYEKQLDAQQQNNIAAE